MTFVEVFRVAILVLHVCARVCVRMCYASKSPMQRAVDDERQTIDARAPYVRVCSLDGRGKEEK